jgi:hypothetical protein
VLTLLEELAAEELAAAELAAEELAAAEPAATAAELARSLLGWLVFLLYCIVILCNLAKGDWFVRVLAKRHCKRSCCNLAKGYNKVLYCLLI